MNEFKNKGVKINLDKERNLIYDMNALSEIEDRYETIDNAFKNLSKGSIKATRFLLWCGLISEDETLTERQVGAMITIGELEGVATKLAEAMAISTPKSEGKK